MGLIALLVYSKKTILTMRNYRKLVLIVFLVSGSLFGWATNLKPFVVPELTQWQGGEGQMQPSGQIVVASPALRSMAQTLLPRLHPAHRTTDEYCNRQQSQGRRHRVAAEEGQGARQRGLPHGHRHDMRHHSSHTKGALLGLADRAPAIRTAAIATLWLNCRQAAICYPWLHARCGP